MISKKKIPKYVRMAGFRADMGSSRPTTERKYILYRNINLVGVNLNIFLGHSSRPHPKAPLVMEQLLPHIFLFHFSTNKFFSSSKKKNFFG